MTTPATRFARTLGFTLVASLSILAGFGGTTQDLTGAALEPVEPTVGVDTPSSALAPTPDAPERALAATDHGEVSTVPSAGALGCLPEPTATWDGRGSDDEWTRGLFPQRESYTNDGLVLTFDDGPHKTRTPQALAGLARRDMHATFFLTGHSIRSNSYHLVQQMVDEGHTLANHGWRHDTRMADGKGMTLAQLEAYIDSEFELTQIRVDMAMMAESAEDFAAMDREVFDGLRWSKHDRDEQLARMPQLRERHRQLLESRGYAQDNRPVTLDWARPPGGNPYMGGKSYSNAEREAFARVLNRRGMRLAMWNGGSGDSNTNLPKHERMDPKRVAKTARTAASKGGIYVAHDRIEPAALDAMLTAVAHSDVEVVSLEDLWVAKVEASCELREAT